LFVCCVAEEYRITASFDISQRLEVNIERQCIRSVQPFGHSARTLQTGQTDRQDRQRSDSIGRTVLQTVAQKLSLGFYCDQ